MKLKLMGIGLTVALAIVGPGAATAARPDVVIGDIEDLSAARHPTTTTLSPHWSLRIADHGLISIGPTASSEA